MRILITICIVLCGVNSNAQMNSNTLVLDDFEENISDSLPKNWYDRDGRFELIKGPIWEKENFLYAIKQEENNKFLRYEGIIAKHINLPLVNHPTINFFETPILSWKWRIHDLPAGANENKKNLNDTAASIYVVFDYGRVLFKKVPKSIRYTWSTTLPVGKILSKFNGNQKIIVVGSGDNEIDSWQTFERNIVEDYKRLFGDTPPSKPLAILLLSDGNDTNDRVSADYDNILLKSDRSN